MYVIAGGDITVQKVNLPYIVYMHVAPNGKKYVGITSQTLSGRCRKNGGGYSTSSYFWRAIQKYGWDNFEHIVIADGLTQEEACALEIKLIREFQLDDERFGYNTSAGGSLGNLGRPCSEETRRKISDAKRGKPLSEEAKRKISITQKGRVHTAEHNKKVSDALKGKYVGELSSAYGLKRSDETRKRMSESAKKGWEKRRQKYADNKWYSDKRRSWRNPT